MDMGVCCTNELAQNEALACLRDWLKMHGNPGFASLFCLCFILFTFSVCLCMCVCPYPFSSFLFTEVRGIWERGEAARANAGSVFVSNHKQVP